MPHNKNGPKKLLYLTLNWYVGHFRFPHRGWKYFRSFLRFFSLDKETYKRKLPGGAFLNVCPIDHIQKDLFWYGYYERYAIGIWSNLLDADSVVYDVGANIGYYSIVAAKKASAGQVYAFEPLSTLRRTIKENIDLNRLHNVRVCDYALYNETVDLTAYHADEENIGMSSLLPPENFSGKTEKVRAISLDTWIKSQKAPGPDLIKIDVEGAELLVLQGMKNALSESRPALIIEVIATQLYRFAGSVVDLYSYLRSYDYIPYEILTESAIRPVTSEKQDYNILFLPREFILPKAIKIYS